MSDYYVYFYYEQDAIEPFYVGKGRRKRAWSHLEPNHLRKKDCFHKKLNQMIRDREEFTIEVIQDELTEAEAHSSEIYFIAQFGRLDLGTGCLCNHTDGGEGKSGSTWSEETRAKIIATRIARGVGLGNRYNLGYVQSYDTRLKHSKKRSPEFVKDLIERMTKERGIPVESFNLITGETTAKYRTASEAARKLGYSRRGIQTVANGHRKSHGGVGWRYSRIESIIDPNSFALKPFET